MDSLTTAAHRALDSVCADVQVASREDFIDGTPVQIVARPDSTHELSNVMKAAAAHSLVVVGRGRGTKMTWGRPPATANVVIDLSRLDRVLDHAEGDLVVVAQAGTLLSDVNNAVACSGQRLAIDETVPGSSIGGTIATATSGPRRLSFGSVRDLLIGVTIVRADGVVAKAGGRVVKNVAGYDLCKLMTGSFGTMAMITEAIFRLHPLPAAQSYVTATVDGAEEAHRILQAVMNAQVVAGALEVDWPTEGARNLTVMLEGSTDGVKQRAATTVALIDAFAEETTTTQSPPHEFGAYPWPLDASGDDRATALKMTSTLSGVPRILETARKSRVPVQVKGSAGVGVLYGAIAPMADATEIAETVRSLRAACEQNGGSLVVLDAANRVKAQLDTWGTVPAIDLMRAVKHQFDPAGRLAPGRFVGGI